MSWLINKIRLYLCRPTRSTRLDMEKGMVIFFRFFLCLIVFAAPGRSFGLGLEVDPGEINGAVHHNHRQST